MKSRNETRFLLVCIVAAAAVAACGKKGPPLAPFVRVPAQVADAVASRLGDEVYVSFTVPVANADGREPADIGAVEVFAVTATRAPETEDQLKVATRIATLPVRPPLPEPAAAEDGTPLPAPPRPPGVDRGAIAVVREALTPGMEIPVALPAKKGVRAVELFDDEEPDTARALVAPAPVELPRRHYVVVGVSPRGRSAAPSPPKSIPLEPASAAPGPPTIVYTEASMTVEWPPSPGARTATFGAPPLTIAAAAGTPAANTSPGNVTPAAPPLPVLVAKSLGFNSQATTYHVYDVSSASPQDAPPALTLPAPLTPQPVAATSLPIAGVTFGIERCFFVRPVDDVFGVVVQGPASPTTCVTPVDSFPPAAPLSLAAIGSAGVISLIWEPNTEADLAGYLVLRGEAPGDTLQALTPAPMVGTSYRDTTVSPGVRYVYAVIAVDKAATPNMSAQSNRAEETARQ